MKAPSIHLTLTGYNAGQTLCGAPRVASGEYRHAVYVPLERDDVRAQCCPECVLEFARSYLPDPEDKDNATPEEFPNWVEAMLCADNACR